MNRFSFFLTSIITAVVISIGAVGCTRNNNENLETRSDVPLSMDQTFINEAASGGLFEVRSSQAALDRATTAETRDFAQRMIEDHSDANNRLKRIGEREGFRVPSQMMKKHADMVARLNAAEGDHFDQRYREMQAQAHDEAIELFERAARECRNEDLREFARNTLPILREHRKMLQEHLHPSATAR